MLVCIIYIYIYIRVGWLVGWLLRADSCPAIGRNLLTCDPHVEYRLPVASDVITAPAQLLLTTVPLPYVTDVDVAATLSTYIKYIKYIKYMHAYTDTHIDKWTTHALVTLIDRYANECSMQCLLAACMCHSHVCGVTHKHACMHACLDVYVRTYL
jgi:hypothetical protein